MKLHKLFWATLLLVFTLGCGEDDGGDDGTPAIILASFSYEVANDSVVTFTNESVNATSYSWDFGDGATSTEENPVHTFNTGTYTVTLTASADGAEDNSTSESITLTSSVDPNSPIQLLTSGTSKEWKLSTEANAINFGPMDNSSTIWWGTPENAHESRSCLFDNVYTFNFDGSYVRDINGALWKEWKFFDEVSGEGCLDESEDAVTRFDTNVNDWKDGSFTFEIVAGDSTDMINVTGSGGYIGHYTSGVESSDYSVKDFHSYSITSISADRLELQAFGYGGDSDGLDGYDPDKPDRLVRIILVPAN